MQSFSIQSRLGGFYFFYYAIVGTFMPYWSLYLQDQGFSFAEIGWLSAIAIITRFFAPFIWGWVADKTGKRMFLVRIATWMEASIWFLIFIIPNDFQSIAFLMLIFSFFQNAILAQFEGVTLFWLGEKRNLLYGKVRKWGSIGFIVGVFLIGAILEIVEISMLPILLLSISFLAFLWSFTIKEPTGAPRAQKTLNSILPVLKIPIVKALFLTEFIMLFAQAPFYSFYSNYLQSFGYSTTAIGFLWAVGVISEIIMFAYAYLFLQHFSWRNLILFCLAATGLRFVIVGLFPDVFLLQFFSQTLHAFSFGLFHMLAMRIIFDHFQAEQQGRAQALYSTMWGLGVASGSILAGNLWQEFSGEKIFLIAGVSTLLGLIFIQKFPKNKPNVAVND